MPDRISATGSVTVGSSATGEIEAANGFAREEERAMQARRLSGVLGRPGAAPVKKGLTFPECGFHLESRAEPSRAEPSRAEPSRAEPSRAEPSRAEPSRAEPSRAEPSRAEPSRAEPSRAEPSRAEPSRAEPSRAEPSRAEPSRAGSSTARPRRLTACRPLGAAIPLHRPHPPPRGGRVSRAWPARGAASSTPCGRSPPRRCSRS